MIRQWLKRRADHRADKAVLVTALLAHLGPLTVTGLQRYVRGSFVGLYRVLEQLEGCGRVESDWIDGPYPRRRVYRLATTEESA